MPRPLLREPAVPRQRAAVLLLLAGVAVWFYFFGAAAGALLVLGPFGLPALIVMLAIVTLLAAARPTSVPLGRALDQLRRPSRRGRWIGSAVAGAGSIVYLAWTAHAQGRPLWPIVHDEFSYLIQAHQFARGHLWMPAHPLAPFVDSFQLFTTPVYASAYFPGTALLYVPGIWLGLPAWVTSLVIAGGVAALLFRITAELVENVSATLAVLLLWSDRLYRTLSIQTMGQPALLLYGLLATVAWLNWRQDRRRWWAASTGACLGLAAVTRPVDALCFATPIGLDVLLHLRRATRGRLSSMLAFGLPLVPLLGVQLTLNRGVSGHLFQTPFRLYADRDYPGSAYGFHADDPAARPASTLPQKQALYNTYRPLIRAHRWANAWDQWARLRSPAARLPQTLTQTTPTSFPLLVPLMPLALLGLTRRRAVVLAALPAFVLLYVPYVFFFAHYALTASAALIVAIVIGATAVGAVAPRWSGKIGVAMPLLIAALAVAAFPQWDLAARDEPFHAPLLTAVNRALAALSRRPAIVLFTFDPARNLDEEPVYNADVAWPDDAEVIRAHDLGAERDAALFRYYAARQPGRFVYRYDERTGEIIALGVVANLAKPSLGTQW